MRVLNLIGLLALSVVAAACGGDSANSKDDHRENQGGEGGSPDTGDAGSNAGGENGDAGDGAGGVTGGRSAGGGTNRGGTGTGGGSAGAGAVPVRGGAGGGMPVPGGSPGTGGTATIDPPEGCEINGPVDVQVGFCGLSLVCDGSNFVKTYCYDQGAGISYCECSTNTGIRTLQVSGPPSATACEVASELCLEPPEPGKPVECMPRLESRNATYCQIERVCNQEVDSDVSVGVVSSVFCQDDGTGRQLCSCSGQSYQYYVEGEDGLTACDTLFEYCDDVVKPTFEGEGECRPQFQNGGPGYCEMQTSCLLTEELADSIYIAQNTYSQTSCSSTSETSSTCNCFNGLTSVAIDREGPVSGIESCTAASSLCEKIAQAEPEGEVTCENAQQFAQANYCNAVLNCTASATIDGMSFDLRGAINVDCNGSPGAWSCNCSSGTNYATVSAQGDTPWDACTDASSSCETAVEVQFGSGPGTRPPLPVPMPGGGNFAQ